MSNHHAKPQIEKQDNRLLRVIVVVTGALIFIAVATISRYRFDRPWPSVGARVLKTRIVTVGAEDNAYHGGVFIYRAEAYVSYQLNGKKVQRWVPASRMYNDRAYLALWLSQKKGTLCIVHWNPNNPSDIEAVLH